MTHVLEYSGGVLDIHDTAAAMEVLEYGLRNCSDPRRRQDYLGLATLCCRWMYAAPTLAWLGADDTAALVEQYSVLTAARTGDHRFIATLAAYGGIVAPTQQSVLHDMLWQPKAQLMHRVLSAARPVRYLTGAVRTRMAAAARQMPQARMAELVESEAPAVMLAKAGIDVEAYVAEIAATDPTLARGIEAWADSQPISQALYRRVLRHLRQPRARAIAKRIRKDRPRLSCWMATPNWFYTVPGRLDTVWHRQNARIIGR
jgi:hypothetical protein